jgi:hypothetical protein
MCARREMFELLLQPAAAPHWRRKPPHPILAPKGAHSLLPPRGGGIRWGGRRRVQAQTEEALPRPKPAGSPHPTLPNKRGGDHVRAGKCSRCRPDGMTARIPVYRNPPKKIRAFIHIFLIRFFHTNPKRKRGSGIAGAGTRPATSLARRARIASFSRRPPGIMQGDLVETVEHPDLWADAADQSCSALTHIARDAPKQTHRLRVLEHGVYQSGVEHRCRGSDLSRENPFVTGFRRG